MKRFAVVCLLALTTSCFFMPLGAPHYHSYKSENNNLEVGVFCTPRTKVYHLFYDENSEIKASSKVFFEEGYITFELDSFFDHQKFQKTIKIRDKDFHKLFEIDTLKIQINNSKKSIYLLPYK